MTTQAKISTILAGILTSSALLMAAPAGQPDLRIVNPIGPNGAASSQTYSAGGGNTVVCTAPNSCVAVQPSQSQGGYSAPAQAAAPSYGPPAVQQQAPAPSYTAAPAPAVPTYSAPVQQAPTYTAAPAPAPAPTYTAAAPAPSYPQHGYAPARPPVQAPNTESVGDEYVIPNAPIITPSSIIEVSAVGMGVAPDTTMSPAQALALAKRAAIVDAYRQIGEKVYGIRVNAQDTLRDMVLRNSTVKTKVLAIIRNAEIIETVYKDGLCQVSMELKLDGKRWYRVLTGQEL